MGAMPGRDLAGRRTGEGQICGGSNPAVDRAMDLPGYEQSLKKWPTIAR